MIFAKKLKTFILFLISFYAGLPTTLHATSVGPWNIVSTLAGNGNAGSVDGVGTAAQFYLPYGVSVGSDGHVYVADTNNHRIRKIAPNGTTSLLAGSTPGYQEGSGAAAQFSAPLGVSVGSDGHVYVADTNNHRIRKIAPNGTTSLLAGSTRGYAEGAGDNAKFYGPFGVSVGSDGHIYVADTNNHRIRKIAPNGTTSLLAGSGIRGSDEGIGAAAQFHLPYGVSVGSDGHVYVADTNNHRIRKIAPNGTTSLLAGSTRGYQEGSGAAVQFNDPFGVSVGSDGHIYVADTHNDRIRKIAPNGTTSLIAGSTRGYAEGPGAAAQFYIPSGISVDGDGHVYVADAGNNRIRKIDAHQINITGVNDVSPIVTLEGNTLYKSINGVEGSTLALGIHTLTFDKNDIDSIFNGSLTGTGAFTINGDITFGGSSQDYSGAVDIKSGIVTIKKDKALGTGDVTMQGGSTLQWGADITLPNKIVLDAAVSSSNPKSATIDTGGFISTLAGTITETLDSIMQLIVQGGATLTLKGQASHTGGTEVLGSTTLKAGIANLFTSVNHTLSLLDAGSTFDMSAGDQTLGDLNGVSGTFIHLDDKMLTFGTANDTEFSGIIQGNGGKIVKQGTGTWRPLEVNTYSGGSTINAGSVAVVNNSSLGTGAITMADGTTLELGFVHLSNPIMLNAGPDNKGITFNLGSNPSGPAGISSVIDGDNKLLIKGSRELYLTKQNLFTGGVELYETARLSLVGDGNLASESDVSLKSSGTIFDISLTSGSIKLGALNSVEGSQVWLGDKTLTLTKNSNFIGLFTSTGNSSVIVDNGSTLTLGGLAPRILQINEDGTAKLTSSASILEGTNIILAEQNATFDASDYAPPFINLGSLNGVQGTSFKWGNHSLTLNGPSASKFNGVLEGGNNSSIIINSDLTLGGQNLNTPFWTLNGATLTMKAGSTLPSNSSLVLNSNNAVFDMSDQNQTIAALRTYFPLPNSRVELGDKTLTLDMPEPIDASAFSGQINGEGGKIVKKGPGSMTFRGSNTFSGGLLIEEGSVRVSSVSAVGSGPITIYDQATLSFGTPLTLGGNNSIDLQSGTANLQVDFPTIITTEINGDGGFNKTGMSSLTLTQDNEYKGDTFVKAGILAINGSAGNIIVDSGATLTGTGSVGTVINNGTVTPSDPVGVFTIKGDYLPSLSGITQIAINPDTSNKLHVKETAHLNNSILSVDVVPGDAFAYENHESFLVLESDHPVDGQFGAIQSSHVRFMWTPDYDADKNKVFLDVNYVPFKDIVNPNTENPNIREVVQYFDTLPQPMADPDLKHIFSTLNATPDAQGITNFFSEVSPDELLLTEETATLVNEINGFRMHYLRDMVASPLTVAGFTTTKAQKATALMNQLKQAFGHIKHDDPRVHSPAMAMNISQQMQESAILMSPKGGIWIQGFGNTSKQKPTGINMGYRNKMAGSLIGVDYKLRPDLFVGLTVGYDQSRIKWIDALSKGKIKDYLASVYSTWFYNKFYINASMTGSYNRYNIRRRMTFGPIDRTARSRHDGYVLAPSLEVGHGFTLFNGIDVVPFIRGDYIHIHEKGYTEKEAGALNLYIRSKTNTALRTEPGLNFYRHFKQEEGIITAKVKLSYVNKHPLKNGKITANLVGQPGTFLASGTNKTQHQASPGLSIDYKANSGLFVSAAYDAQFGSTYKAHEVSLKVGHRF